ncbi:nested antisense gene NAG1 [Kluyveromyces marxianus DMKU3-1042]|uniref:Nested antisense gene NAG1 n=1 Tax=Kluyveromyces marxianus (strain DMKU3-1042 / BCC 29191 / NBRC 104275) TaxID=1003335 RepID=W0TB62_KLUMD|nr:protein NAG1 [Kluyveromyces marxianus DMKU3-1042]BAO40852.1 nested antisense gene NAG1 [Kluyveromyces marxianus DMKU3-1042]
MFPFTIASLRIPSGIRDLNRNWPVSSSLTLCKTVNKNCLTTMLSSTLFNRSIACVFVFTVGSSIIFKSALTYRGNAFCGFVATGAFSRLTSIEHMSGLRRTTLIAAFAPIECPSIIGFFSKSRDFTHLSTSAAIPM